MTDEEFPQTRWNFSRIHKTLKVTPAMEAGISDSLHDAEWIVELMDARAPNLRSADHIKRKIQTEPLTGC